MLELVRQTSAENLNQFKFNDMTDHDIQVTPDVIWEELNSFSQDYFDGELNLELDLEKQFIKMIFPAESQEDQDLIVKLKFFDLNTEEASENDANDEDEEENCEPKRLRLRFTKKRGDLAKWYEIFNDMKSTVFEDLLLAPRLHHEQQADNGHSTAEESPREEMEEQ